MKRASSSFLLVIFAALFVSLQTYAQIEMGRPNRGHRPGTHDNRPGIPEVRLPSRGEVLQEQIGQNLRSFQRLRVSELLRLPWHEQSSLEVRSLRIVAQSLMGGQSALELSSRGQFIGSQLVRRHLSEALFILPPGVSLESLELSSPSELYLSSLSVEVERKPVGGFEQQVAPQSVFTLQVNRTIYGFGSIQLDQLARQQLGVTFEGAEIERVVVDGSPLMNGSAASVQVELNRRAVGEMKYLSRQERKVPLQVRSVEEVRSLAILVSGDAQIMEVRIRVGQVRPRGYEMPRSERIRVAQEVSPRFPLSLSQILRYETRMIRSITIVARSMQKLQAQLKLLSNYGESEGVLFIGTNTITATLPLRRPMAAHELRFEAHAPVMIESLELEFDMYQRY
jgi:hypothetical protein